MAPAAGNTWSVLATAAAFIACATAIAVTTAESATALAFAAAGGFGGSAACSH